jgi:PAS domain S-box-containing protein
MSNPEIMYGELVHGIRQVVEKKRAEIKLRKSQAEFFDLYNNAPNAYFSVGVNDCILRCNNRAEDLLGYPSEKLVGRPVMDLYADTPEGKEAAAEVFKRLQIGKLTSDQELQMQKVDGTLVWISLTVDPVYTDHGSVIESRLMVVDISERKKNRASVNGF